MTSTFYLKESKSIKNTLIYFSCYFKYEGKKFVYSTGENITPKNWDFQNNRPILKGKDKCKEANSIENQLNRYLDCFTKRESLCKITGQQFTSTILRKAFDSEFKKVITGKNLFYDSFDEFVEYKSKNLDWSPSTVKRYTNIKNILKGFESSRNYKVNFTSLNDKFHAEFTDYCVNERAHINNTYSRNLGLIKTFLFWAVEKNYTHNMAFLKFKKKKRVVTKQIALKFEDLESLMKQEFKTKRLERIRDVFVFACVTGLRFGELKLIRKENIYDDNILLKEEKESSKEARQIPLNDLSKFILTKYDYKLPLIANQKHNEYIKEVFKNAGYTHSVEKVTTKGKENIRETLPFYDRISSHTARRTFITLMKKKGHSDKLIASISGHRDFKTLNVYYQVDDESKNKAVKETFDIKFPTLKKA
jgi:integrase